MDELRITDLANPVLIDARRRLPAHGETPETDFDPERLLAQASAAVNPTMFERASIWSAMNGTTIGV